jgi:hypothetical protein
MRNNGTSTTHLERVSESVTRSLAGRTSRRSFIGRLGKGAVAASLGSAGVALLRAPASAFALPCSGCSIACRYLRDWNQNSCPTNSCMCGSWVIHVLTTTCSSGYRRWTDCCNSGWCGAHGGERCDTSELDGSSHPTCHNPKDYPNTVNDTCGSSTTKIVCRKHNCVSSGAGAIDDYCHDN